MFLASPILNRWLKVHCHCFRGGARGNGPIGQCRRLVRDMGSISGQRRFPGGGHGTHSSVFLPGKSHGQRSLADYGPGDCKGLDMTEDI